MPLFCASHCPHHHSLCQDWREVRAHLICLERRGGLLRPSTATAPTASGTGSSPRTASPSPSQPPHQQPASKSPSSKATTVMTTRLYITPSSGGSHEASKHPSPPSSSSSSWTISAPPSSTMPHPANMTAATTGQTRLKRPQQPQRRHMPGPVAPSVQAAASQKQSSSWSPPEQQQLPGNHGKGATTSPSCPSATAASARPHSSSSSPVRPGEPVHNVVQTKATGNRTTATGNHATATDSHTSSPPPPPHTQQLSATPPAYPPPSCPVPHPLTPSPARPTSPLSSTSNSGCIRATGKHFPFLPPAPTGHCWSPEQGAWAHTLARPEPGCLLIARKSNMNFFNRAVLLITSHGKKCSSLTVLLIMPQTMKSIVMLQPCCSHATAMLQPHDTATLQPHDAVHESVLHRPHITW